MANDAKIVQDFQCRMRVSLFPALFWAAGFFLGSLYAHISQRYFVSLMLSAVQQPMSIVARMICVALPFFFFFSTVYSRGFACIYIYCFIKSISYGFNITLLLYLFQSSAWVVSALFLFSDTVFCVLLLWLCMRFQSVDKWKFRKDALLCLSLCVAALLIDILFFMPLLRRLL